MGPWKALTHGRWKLVLHQNAPVPVLFDLQNDPRETENVAPARPIPVRELMERLSRRVGTRGVDELQEGVSPELEERLRALGYVE
jgi:arylsulfatase A-like enzyme